MMIKDIKEKKASQIKETINSFIDWRIEKPDPVDLEGEPK